jgi:hypothetical protein
MVTINEAISMKKNIIIITSSITISLILLLSLSHLSEIDYFKKMYALVALNDSSQLNEHEISVKNHIGHQRDKVVIMGSCQVENGWCTKDTLATKCSLQRLLEREFTSRDHHNIRVMNLGIPQRAENHNLVVFLKTLKKKDFKYYLWHNDNAVDASTVHFSKQEIQLGYDREVISLLREVASENPDIDEIPYYIELIKKFRKDYKLDNSPKKQRAKKKDMGDQIKDLVRYIRINTKWLVAFQDYLYLSRTDYLPDSEFKEHAELLHKVFKESKGQKIEKVYYQKPESFDPEKVDIQLPNILTLKIIAKLAKQYNKKVFVYFEPGGNCQSDNIWTTHYKNKIINGIKDLPQLKILDLTDIQLVHHLETFNCINTTFIGSKRLAKRIYKEIVKYVD